MAAVSGEVAVANQALALIGAAPVTGFGEDSPERTQQVLHAWFDAARVELLSLRGWRFASVTERLQPSDYIPIEATWNLSYVYPAGCLKFLRVVDVFATISDGTTVYPDFQGGRDITLEQVERDGIAQPSARALISPTGYRLNEIWSEARGFLRKWEVRTIRGVEPAPARKVILTNLPDGVGEWVIDVENTALWDAAFRTCFAWYLAHKIAAAVTGQEAKADRAYQQFLLAYGKAEQHDAQEQNNDLVQPAAWIAARRSG